MSLFGLEYGGTLSDIGFWLLVKSKAIAIIPLGSMEAMSVKDNCISRRRISQSLRNMNLAQTNYFKL